MEEHRDKKGYLLASRGGSKVILVRVKFIYINICNIYLIFVNKKALKPHVWGQSASGTWLSS